MRSVATQVIPAPQSGRQLALTEIARAYIETTKPGITRLVTITAALGLALTAMAQGVTPEWTAFVRAMGSLAGVFLASSGVNALNQWWEAPRDALMPRTRRRPIPSERLSSTQVAWFGLFASVVGIALTAVAGGPAAGLLTLVTAIFYVLIYTPMKTRTAWNTLVGAVPGALPPLIGSAAAAHITGTAPREAMLDPIGWSLFVMMMVWQLPHFFAIAAMYKDDYRAAGFRMLSTIDTTGRPTAIAIFATAVALVPASLVVMPASGGLVGLPYAIVALVAGGLMLHAAWGVLRAEGRARRVFFASIVYLPTLCIALVVEAAVRTLAR